MTNYRYIFDICYGQLKPGRQRIYEANKNQFDVLQQMNNQIEMTTRQKNFSQLSLLLRTKLIDNKQMEIMRIQNMYGVKSTATDQRCAQGGHVLRINTPPPV